MQLRVGRAYFDKYGDEYLIVKSDSVGQERYYYNSDGIRYDVYGKNTSMQDVPGHYSHLKSEVSIYDKLHSSR